MSEFSDWLNCKTPMDRRHWLTEVVSWLLSARSMQDLAKLLTLDDMLRAKLANVGPYAIVEDFAKSYPAFYEVDEDLARNVLEKFLTFVFTHEKEIPLDNVVAWLQPLSDPRLLRDSADLVKSATWMPTGADRAQWKRYALRLRRIRANLLRRGRRYDEAVKEFYELIDEWKKFDPEERKELAIIEYELAYIAYLHGRIDEAVKMYSESARHAAQASDPIGELIGLHCVCKTLSDSRRKPARKARAEFEKIRTQLVKEGRTQARATNWVFNTDSELFKVACDLGDVKEARRLANVVLASDAMRTGGADRRYRIIRAKIEGRLALAEKDWEGALRKYAPFLDVDLCQWGEQDPELVQFAVGEDGAAEAYRDAGVALLELGEALVARKTWRRGMKCPSNNCNWFSQEDIQRLLAEATSG